MNATMVASGTKAVPPVVSSIQDIPLAKIRESKTNPRRQFDDSKLAEFADFVSRNKISIMWPNTLCGVVLLRQPRLTNQSRIPSGAPNRAFARTYGENSNLARTAARYKIDGEKAAATVRAELTNTKRKSKATEPSAKASSHKQWG